MMEGVESKRVKLMQKGRADSPAKHPKNGWPGLLKISHVNLPRSHSCFVQFVEQIMEIFICKLDEKK